MPGFTTKFYYEILAGFFTGSQLPASFFLALVTDDNAPGPDTKTLSQLTEIATGNGYIAGGVPISRAAASFPMLLEDDVNQKGVAGLKDIILTGNGGPIPRTGKGARYAVLTGPGAVIGDRKVYLYDDLVVDKNVSKGQDLRMEGLTAELSNQGQVSPNMTASSLGRSR